MLTGKIYIPYMDYDPEHGFDADLGFTTRQQYVDYLMADYQRNKLSIVSNNGRFSCSNPYINAMSPSERLHYEKKLRQTIERHTKYYEVPMEIRDMNGNEQAIDNLIRFYQTKEMFIARISFNRSIQLEEAYMEFRTWLSDSMKIMKSNRLDMEMKLNSLTPIDFKVSFGNDSNAILYESKLLEAYSMTSYSVLVKNIIFVNQPFNLNIGNKPSVLEQQRAMAGQRMMR